MSEVSSRVCLPLVEEVAIAGGPPASLLRGLSLTADELWQGSRLSWDEFVLLLARASSMIGSLDRLSLASGARPLESSLLSWIRSRPSHASVLYMAGIGYASELVTNVRFRCIQEPDGRLRFSADVRAGYSESPEFFEYLAGALRRLPHLVGLPEAAVQVEVAGRKAVYTISLPRTRTRFGRLSARATPDADALVGESIRALAAYERDQRMNSELVAEAHHQLRLQTRQLEAFHQIGRHIGHSLQINSLGFEICELFVRYFDISAVKLWLTRPQRVDSEPLQVVGKPLGEPSQRHMLTVADRVIGRLELWEGVAGAAPESRDLLEQLLPWLASALDNACASHALVEQTNALAREAASRCRAESQLLQAQKMEAVGRLARGITHDFNNLLTTINGFAHIASERLPEASPARAAVEQVQIAGERGVRLVHKLLSLRKRAMRPERVNLNQLIQQMEPILTQMLGENMRLKLDLEPLLAPLIADPTHIEQILINLAENARDAMHTHGTLRIGTSHAAKERAERENASGEMYAIDPGPGAPVDVRLWISDDGRGMDEETCSRIFEPFFTTKSHTQNAAGLGMSTVYQIVTQSGGRINVSSAVGNGTLVTIDLPCEDEPFEDEIAELAPAAGQVVLLVDDDPQVRALGVQILEERGYTVIEAADGRQALERISHTANDVRVVVTDIVMPEMDGRQLGGELLQHCPDLKGVIYVSGYQDLDLGVYSRLPGQAAFLRKPFTHARLLSAVQRTLA